MYSFSPPPPPPPRTAHARSTYLPNSLLSPGHGRGADSRYEDSVQLTHEEVMHVMRDIGFEITHESRHDCKYACNDLAMKQTVYKAVCFTARKPAAADATAAPPAASAPTPPLEAERS